MPVAVEDVLNQLDRDEPNYLLAARLGPEALPHLITLIQTASPGLAAKAAFLAGFIKVDQSRVVVEIAARNSEPIVRVAAAASAKNLASIPASLALDLLNDADAGVRKQILRTLEVHQPPGIRPKLEDIVNNDPHTNLRALAKTIIDRLTK